jgi:hypothetical protein
MPKIDFSQFVDEPWKRVLRVLKQEMERRMDAGEYHDSPEREYPLADLQDDLGMVEWVLNSGYPPDGYDNRKKD